MFYLIKCLLGGLLVFEIGLSEPYAYGHLYSVEATRFKACSARTLNSQVNCFCVYTLSFKMDHYYLFADRNQFATIHSLCRVL